MNNDQNMMYFHKNKLKENTVSNYTVKIPVWVKMCYCQQLKSDKFLLNECFFLVKLRFSTALLGKFFISNFFVKIVHILEVLWFNTCQKMREILVYIALAY